jgi:MFS family permease
MNPTTHRIAVKIFFFVNGFVHANLMARLPLLQKQLAISDSILGTLLFSVALGAMLGMPVAGGLAGRFGSHRLAMATALGFCLLVPLIPLAHSVWLAGALFALMGAFMGGMDVCMNGQAVLVERLWQRPIMSSFHAVFSIGMALGAGIGALATRIQVPLPTHLGVMALLGAGLILWASGRQVREEPAQTDASSDAPKSGLSRLPKAIWPLGLIAFGCMTGEGSMTDWSAIYMDKVVGQGPTWGAVAFGTYAVGMTLGRLFGDHLTAKLGKRRLMIGNALLTIGGLGLALAFPGLITTLVGLLLVGLGVSTIVPIVFSTAGNTKGVNPSAGIAMATSIGYMGFFVGPPTIGFLSDAFGLRAGLGFSLALFGLMLILVLKFIKR